MAMLELYTSRMEQESEEALEAVPLGAFAVRRGITMGFGATDLGIAKARSRLRTSHIDPGCAVGRPGRIRREADCEPRWSAM